MGYHGNHAFSHSPNSFIFKEHFFSHSGYPKIPFGTNEKLSLGCKVGQIDHGVILF